jgi:DNA-binding CsgD family transcriptional regulator
MIDQESIVQKLLEASCPSDRQALPQRPADSLGAWTALLVDPTRELAHTLQLGLLNSGARQVILARSKDQVDEIVRQHPSGGDLAVVSARLRERVDPIIKKLRGAGWDRVLLFSAVGDFATTVSAINAGATGVLCWPTPYAQFPPPLQTRGLSKREQQVLTLVAEGLSNPQIGAELGLATTTVKRHVARIGTVIGTGNRSQMVAIALRAGIL